jgi:diguanylate cyclase (GGDEF)-like protein
MPENATSAKPTSKILLVSDSELTNRSIGKLLGERFQVSCAAHGEAGWRIAAEHPDIDLVISLLPLAVDQGGLIERLRCSSNPRLCRIPVLLLIGESDSVELRDQALVAGATDFIYAPFSRLEFETRVALHTHMLVPSGETTGEFTANLESLEMLNTVMQRDYFLTRLGQELAFCDRHRTYMCIVHLRMLGSDDLIGQFGQPVFAALVRTMAHEINKKTRAEDSVAYLGGAGFALQLPVTNGISAQGVLNRLMDKLAARRLRYHGTYISVTFCAGLYVRTTRDASTVDQIMDELEKRVELAQKMGAGQIVSSGSDEEIDYSVDQALNKLRYDQVDGLDKHLSRLLDEVKPLLRFARDHDEIGFEDLLESVRQDDPGT